MSDSVYEYGIGHIIGTIASIVIVTVIVTDHDISNFTLYMHIYMNCSMCVHASLCVYRTTQFHPDVNGTLYV